MSDIASDILNTTVSTVVGALLPPITSAIKDFYIARSQPGLLGRWHAKYQRGYEPDKPWTTEKVQVYLLLGQLRLKNYKDPTRDKFIACGKIIQEQTLAGYWKSTNPGSSNSGGFILEIHPRGLCMYGYFSTSNNSGGRAYCGWVLAKKVDDLDLALHLLKQTTLPNQLLQLDRQ